MRQALNLSQEAFAKQIGVTTRTVLNWELGKSEPRLTVPQMKRLCKLLSASIEEIPDSFKLKRDETSKNVEQLEFVK